MRTWHKVGFIFPMLGDNWLVEETSAALQVPSALIASESNFLLNLAHRDFRKLSPGKPIPCKFDSRLCPSASS